jgi:class 3 adenylate cyclase/tetratricopeptide (TPR) repeat protein
LTSKAALEGERKQITVLFADLKGSMELLADRDPEEARRILDPVLELMMEAVHRYEGTVNQVMGDGIMALFGAPLAHEDHAVRACYASLRMQESMKRYAEDARRAHSINVQIRVGLNSGEVVVRAIGSDLHMDYTAVGQTTHLAARMEQLADPGAIVITLHTLALIEGYVEVKALGPVPVKGLAEPVEVYEVTGAGRARTRLEAAARRGLTRFVGRDAEMEQLHRARRRAGAGHGQVAAIVGEAGVGKSRLIHEFAHSPDLHGWLVLESAPASYGKATSYFPVLALLKGYFTLQDRDDLREVHEKVTGKLLTLDEALKPTLPPLLALLDVPVDDAAWQTLDPPQRRQLTLDAVKRLLLRQARDQPLLVIFEDLHWIDGETQALLDTLIESLGSARLLLVVNYRPEYQHGWGSKSYCSQLRLDALPAESTGELLDALLGDGAELAPLKRLLVKRGNPFFLEETIRTLVETKALSGERGRFRLRQPVQAIQVAPTVQAMLAARIDRLSPEDKHLLQVASVVGKDVRFALVQAIAELPDETLRRGLDHLQAADFVYETGLFPDLEYTFKHALTHEVTYSTLLQERRRTLHGRIVGVIERLYADRLVEHVEKLGHHALRGELWDKAVQFLRQAGAKALGRSANGEAATCFEQALDALRRLPEAPERLELAIDLRFGLRNALFSLGHFGRLLDCLREAEVLAEALGDRRRLGRAFGYLAQYFTIMGDQAVAVDYGHRALALGNAIGDVSLQVVAHYYLGLAYVYLGDYRRAAESHRWNIETLSGDLLGERFGLHALPAVLARAWLVCCCAEQGQFDEGIQYGTAGIQIAAMAKDPFSHILIEWIVGLLHLRKGDAETAIPPLEHGLMLCQTTAIRYLFPSVASGLGLAYVLSGRLAEGIALVQQAVEAFRSMGVAGLQALIFGQLSEAYLFAGRVHDAAEAAGRALDLSRGHQERGFEAWTLRLLGEIHSHVNGPAPGSAEGHYRHALAIAAELGMRPLVAHCHLGLGKLYRRTGEREQAPEHLTIATTMYREMDMRFWLEQAEAETRELV